MSGHIDHLGTPDYPYEEGCAACEKTQYDYRLQTSAPALLSLLSHLQGYENAQPHRHHRPAIWDDDNANAGQPCERCEAFTQARLLLRSVRGR